MAFGLVGIAAFWMAFTGWLNTAGTSPLASIFTFVWSCTFMGTAVFTWRRSRLASPAYLTAMGMLLYLLSFIFPGGQLLLLPLFAVIFVFTFVGYQFLYRASQSAI